MPDDEHDHPSILAKAKKSSKSDCLWDCAYENFAASNEKLNDAFQRIAADDLEATGGMNDEKHFTGKQQKFSQLVLNKINDMHSKEWNIHIGNLSINVRTQFARILGLLDTVRDTASQAASLDPVHAGLPVAALYLILSFAGRDQKSREALFSGLEKVSDAVGYCTVLEKVYLTGSSFSSTEALKERLIILYERILEFEALAVCHCVRNTASRLIRNTFGNGAWQDKANTIESLKVECQQYLHMIDRETNSEKMQKVEMISRQQVGAVEKLVKRSMEQQDEVLQAIRDIQSVTANVLSVQFASKQQEDLRKCMQTLCISDYEFSKTEVHDRVPGTCQWVLGHANYRRWLARNVDSASAFLWIIAAPGCGKSVLAKAICSEYAASFGPHVNPCYYFFKARGDEQYESGINALRSLLHQLFSHNAVLKTTHLLRAFERFGKQLANQFEALWQLLESASADERAGQIVYVIDALDECSNEHRELLFTRLVKLCADTASPHRIKVVLTSRPDGSLRMVANKLRAIHGSIMTDIAADSGQESNIIANEITTVIDTEVSKFQKERQRFIEDELHILLREELVKRQNKTYLWLSLIFPLVLKNATAEEDELLAIINDIPGSIEEAYDAILARMDMRIVAESQKLFSILIAAQRDLTLLELYAAMKVGAAPNKPFVEVKQWKRPLLPSVVDSRPSKGATGCSVERAARKDLKPTPSESPSRSPSRLQEASELALFRERVKRLGGLFVQITPDPKKRLERVTLIHKTAADYLLTPPSGSSESSTGWKHSLPLARVHHVLATSCISYILLPDFDKPWLQQGKFGVWKPVGARRSTFLRDHCFLAYAAVYWPIHFNLTSVTKTDPLCADSVTLCQFNSHRHRTWSKVFWDSRNRRPPSTNIDLSVAVAHELSQVVHRMIDDGVDIDGADADGDTALHSAALHGQQSMGAILIERGASVDVRDDEQNTPLLSAASRGLEVMVLLLLSRGADVMARNDQGLTAFHRAAAYGHTKVIEHLIRAGAGPSPLAMPDEQGQTPLHHAALFGQDEAVAFLLHEGRRRGHVADLDINARDKGGRTCLHLVATAGMEVLESVGAAVERLPRYCRIWEDLVGAGADESLRDKEGLTAAGLLVRVNEDRSWLWRDDEWHRKLVKLVGCEN